MCFRTYSFYMHVHCIWGFFVHHTKLMCAAANSAVRLSSGNGFAQCSCRSLCCPSYVSLAHFCVRFFAADLHPASFPSPRLCFTRPREFYLEWRSEYSISFNHIVDYLCTRFAVSYDCTSLNADCVISFCRNALMPCLGLPPLALPFLLAFLTSSS